MGTFYLTAAGHETVYLIWTQITDVFCKAPSAQVLGCGALSRWLDHILWTRHCTAVAGASCPGVKRKDKGVLHLQSRV